MLNDIYLLLDQDIIDFNTLNALPANNQGPQVTPMSYQNQADESSVKMTMTGTTDAVIPAGFRFSDVGGSNIWEISTPVTLDGSGNAVDVYAKCRTDGAIVALAGTLTNIVDSNPDLVSVTNPYNAVVSGETFDTCVDKLTIDDPVYQQWKDVMEVNQSISTRKVITITMV